MQTSSRPPTPARPKPRRNSAVGHPPASGARDVRLVAGVDEAGRGPWAGPVVAAAVVLRGSRLPVRIDDSKRLSPRQRLTAYHAIRSSAFTGVGIIPASIIDRDNIRQATLRAMAIAVSRLPCEPDLILIDGLDAPTLPQPCWTIVDGDHISYQIACASIIAKVTRDRLMDFYHRVLPDYGFDRHKGYGTALHAARLREHGPSVLHRLSFRPVREA